MSVFELYFYFAASEIVRCITWTTSKFMSIMDNFGALYPVLSIVSLSILYRRIFGKYSHGGQSDTVKKNRKVNS